jgi:nitrogenase subunit NifH
MNPIFKTAANITEELSQPNEKSDAKQDGIRRTNVILEEFLKKKWKNKVMHEQYIRNIDGQLISEEDTFFWLSKGDLKAETVIEIVAAQDQVLQTKHYATKILNAEKNSKCRLCQQYNEKKVHITSDAQYWQKKST